MVVDVVYILMFQLNCIEFHAEYEEVKLVHYVCTRVKLKHQMIMLPYPYWDLNVIHDWSREVIGILLLLVSELQNVSNKWNSVPEIYTWVYVLAHITAFYFKYLKHRVQSLCKK